MCVSGVCVMILIVLKPVALLYMLSINSNSLKIMG